jgi:hypothetical protein
VLTIIGGPEVTPVAYELKKAVNAIRHLVIDDKVIPDAEGPEFRAAHGRYREARGVFIKSARAELGSAS